METKLRKYTDDLRISAYGVILFGIWSVLKCIMYFTMDTGIFELLFNDSIDPSETNLTIVVTYMVLGLDLLLRLIVGIAAIKESKGVKKSMAYIVVSAIMFVFYGVVLVYSFADIFKYTNVPFIIDQLVTFLVDATSLYAMGDMIFSGCKVKSLRKMAEKEEM